MNILNAVKQHGAVLMMLLCLLLCGCQVLFPAEHTELVVDGEYKPFNVPRMTMEKLMELVEAENVDYIYEVFSPAVRENTENLYEQIQEFIRFVEENVTAWDFSTGLGDVQRKDGVTTSTRISLFTFDTSSGTYQCDIDEVIKNTVQPNLVGFSGITVFPEELSWEYAPKEPSGIYIVYRVEDKPQNALTEPSSLKILLELAVKEDTDGIDQLFSVTAKRHSKELQKNSRNWWTS